MLPNTKIGEYTLLEKLGAGAMGEVWLAERDGPAKIKCALKIPFTKVSKDEVIKEANLWNSAGPHTNIVPIQQVAEYSGQIVIASEYFSDGSLEDWLVKHGGKAPSVDEAVDITVGILKGLDRLHTLKEPIIHRDLKPANILIRGDTPCIADFGIARILDETLKGTMSGTPAYMAPEAFDGVRTPQVDIWSVGVILYQFVTGELPFPHQIIGSLIRAVRTENIPPLPSSVPEPLQEVISVALKKEPKQRYQSASKMISALKEAAKEVHKANYYNANATTYKEHSNTATYYERTIKTPLRYVLGFGAGLGLGLTPYLGLFNIPFFPHLLNLIPDSMQNTVIPLSAALIGMIVVATLWYGGEHISRDQIRKAFSKTLLIWGAAFVVFIIIHTTIVVKVPILGGEDSVTFIVGFDRPTRPPCDEGVSDVECIKLITLDTAAVESFWGDKQIRLAKLVFILSYLSLTSSFGALIGFILLRDVLKENRGY